MSLSLKCSTPEHGNTVIANEETTIYLLKNSSVGWIEFLCKPSSTDKPHYESKDLHPRMLDLVLGLDIAIVPIEIDQSKALTDQYLKLPYMSPEAFEEHRINQIIEIYRCTDASIAIDGLITQTPATN